MAKERVQVQGLGDVAPGIQPTIQRAGQYGIQVQKAGTNKLQQLAGALSQINPVLQQYGALQKQQEQIGAEQAALVEEQNVIAELQKLKDVDVDRFSPLATSNRDRARRDALLKRYINNTMLPNLKAKESDLLNPELYGDRTAFYQGVDETLTKEWGNLVSQVGEDIANSTAAKALWSYVTVPYKNELAVKHEEAVDNLIAGEKINELTVAFNDAFSGKVIPTGKDLDTLVTNFDKDIAEDLPHYTKQQRSELLFEAVNQQARNLRARRRFTDAARLLDGVELVEVNGKPIFRSTAAFAKLNEIKKSINESLFATASQDTEKVDAEFKGAGRLSFLTMSGKGSVEDLTAEDIDIIKSAFRYIAPDPKTTPDSEFDRIINEEIFGQPGANPSRALLFAMNKLAQANPDDGLRMFQRTLPGILTTLKQTEGILPATARVDLPEVRDGLEAEYRTAFAAHDILEGPFTDADFLKDKPEFKGYTGLKALSDEFNAGDAIRKYTSFTDLDNTLENALIPAAESIETRDQKYKDLLGNTYLSTYKEQSGKIIRTKALQYARELSAEGVEGEEFKNSIDTFINTEVQKDVDLFKELAQSQSERLGKRRVPSMMVFEAIKKKELESYKGVGVFELEKDISKMEYPSLVMEKEDMGQIYADQDKAFRVSDDPTSRHKNVLKGLLVNYGVPSYDKMYAKYLKKAGVDYRTVSVVANEMELDSVLRRWAPVIAKIHGELELIKKGAPTDLNANEKDIWAEMRSFKVFDVAGLNDFRQSQENLLRETRR
jgi:hypothetical protein